MKPVNNAVRFAKDHIEPKYSSNPNLARLVKWDDQDKVARPFSDVYLNRIGNLVLDTVSAGSAKGSGNFSSRIISYTSNSTFLSQGELINFASKDSNGAPTWDESAIKTRQKVLVEFARDNI